MLRQRRRAHPHIDSLARDGTRFELAVTNNPVCMPVRSCLLTGQFSRTCTGFLDHYKPGYWEDPNMDPEYPVEERSWMRDTTVAEALRAVGYETALFGKWHVQPAPHLLGFAPFSHACTTGTPDKHSSRTGGGVRS